MNSISSFGPTITQSSLTRPDRFEPTESEKPEFLDRVTISPERVEELESSFGERVVGELLVKLPKHSDLGKFVADYDATIKQEFHIPKSMDESFNGRLVLLETSHGVSDAETMVAFESDERVLLVATNDLVKLEKAPNDLHPDQWNIKNDGRMGTAGADINVYPVWDTTTGNRETGPIIAVLDSGVDGSHEDLRNNLWRNPDEKPNGIDDDGNGIVDDIVGVNTTEDNGNVQDFEGHGTHVNGIMGAEGNNGKGVVGVNWEARLMNLKVTNGNRISMVGAIFATLYAADKGAKITNNSWGGGQFNSIHKDVLASSPMLHVCSAGNAQRDTDIHPHYPSGYELDNVISVAASVYDDQPVFFSNWGPKTVDIHAPGGLIYSSLPGNEYNYESGTSMATAHVSGVAALVAEQHPKATPQELKDRLIYSAKPNSALQGKSVSGGRLDAHAASETDIVPPGELKDLKFTSVDADGFELQWTSPGDDGDRGHLALIELKARIAGEETWMTPERPAAPGTQDSFVFRLTPELHERDLEFSMQAIDNVGQRSNVVSKTAVLPAATTVFFDDVEQDLDWTSDTWGRVEEPGRGRVWTETPNGDYDNFLDYDLHSPKIDLSESRSTVLTFDARTVTEESDYLWVEASRDGGEEFSFIQVLRGGESPEWSKYTLDLSEFDGEPDVIIRFRLHASDEHTDDGVYLDNIRVMGAKAESS